MPILKREVDLFPEDLLDRDDLTDCEEQTWWALYTLSRREKDLTRRLLALEVPFYSPMIARRSKSPAGRVRTSFVPLFPNYVFVYGDEAVRHSAFTTGCVSQSVLVADGAELRRDLRQFRTLIEIDAALTPEARLEPGTRVRVRTGRFCGIEGIILRRESQCRLLVTVNFLQRGASLLLEDCEVEKIDP